RGLGDVYKRQALINSVEVALENAQPDPLVPVQDAQLLQQYVKKLLRHPRS
ncbi:anti-adapter protein IraP, partial [Enterobacter sp. 63]